MSYAGEDRRYVEQIAAQLKQRDIRVFYDEYETAQLWGSDLYVVLDDVYRKRARFAVIFISKYYASKPWTQHERQSAQARSLTNVDPYLLPVRLDDSEVPGLRPTVGYVDARKTSIQELVDLIEQKLATRPGVTSAQTAIIRSPRTPEQKRELLAQRPPGWEYMLYAGVLWQQRQALESKWRDHELRYARRVRHLGDSEAVTFIQDSFDEVAACVQNLLKMLDPKAEERAFGPPGQAGDPELIEHLAKRFVEGYEELINIASRLRGSGVPDSMAPLMEATARLIDAPLIEIRDFIDLIVVEMDTIPDRLKEDDDQPIGGILTLTLTVDDDAMKNFNLELKRAKRRRRFSRS